MIGTEERNGLFLPPPDILAVTGKEEETEERAGALSGLVRRWPNNGAYSEESLRSPFSHKHWAVSFYLTKERQESFRFVCLIVPALPNPAALGL